MKTLSDNKQTTINLITSLAAFVINAGISFVLTPYILEKLGNEAYGFIGLAYDFVNYAGHPYSGTEQYVLPVRQLRVPPGQ